VTSFSFPTKYDTNRNRVRGDELRLFGHQMVCITNIHVTRVKCFWNQMYN
jgi:hypothetical protein